MFDDPVERIQPRYPRALSMSTDMLVIRYDGEGGHSDVKAELACGPHYSHSSVKRGPAPLGSSERLVYTTHQWLWSFLILSRHGHTTSMEASEYIIKGMSDIVTIGASDNNPVVKDLITFLGALETRPLHVRWCRRDARWEKSSTTRLQ